MTRTRILLPVAALLVIALGVTRVLVGSPMVSAADALAVVRGETIPGVSFIVMDNRLPTVVVAMLAGIALALSGTTFQSLLRNPLASPDVIGVTSGASAAVVVSVAWFGANSTAQFWAALLGALSAALLVVLISGAHRPGSTGSVDGRFVLVGIGVGSGLSAVVAYVVTRLPANTAADALHWMVGSLSSSNWERVRILGLTVVVLIPVLTALVTKLRVLELGDDTATGLGLPVVRVRLGLVLTAVVLAAFSVAVTGPLAFVAFMAGPLAKSLAGRRSFPLSALIGALIVLGADLAAQNVFPGVNLPVGVATGALGAAFLLVLLARNPQGR